MKSFFYLILKIASLVIFISIVPLLFFLENSTSIVWTILLPILPIGILLVGFSNWRNICPLAFFSKISQNINWFEKRKVPEWFEENFYLFQYFLLFFAFTLRLTTLNSQASYLAIFFIIIIAAAFAINLVYTGKSWCNFFCPIGTVEKIYCISNSKNYAENSACFPCTACKRNCPDIDMESNYWREGIDKQKSFVFYSFSGLILGFYLYFYLHSGSFSYYFSGDWTHINLGLLDSGFFFAPFIPVIIAAPLTLALFSLFSFYIFSKTARFLWRNRIFKNANYETTIHRVKVIASFVAFNTFYLFAGAPTYIHYPIAYAIFYFIVVVTSSVVLYKEIFREQSFFIQERFALKILKNWNSDKPVPSNLKEIYYTYINENKDKKERLETYKNTIKDLMQEGILNEESMVILEKLRDQIGISAKDHLNTMRSIKLKHEELFDDNVEKSTEQKYQRTSYKKMIEDALLEHIDLDSKYIKSLQKQFCITDSVHKTIMDTILNNNEKFHDDVLSLLDELAKLLKLENSLYSDGSREITFLKYTIRNEFLLILKDLFSLLFIIYKDNKETLSTLMDIAKNKQVDDSFQFTKETLSFMHEDISRKILLLKKNFDVVENVELDENKIFKNNKSIIITLLSHASLEVATAALLATHSNPQLYLSDLNLDRFTTSKESDVYSLVNKILYQTDNITTYERMMHLNTVPLFANLKFQDLKLLAQTTKIAHFSKDEYIIRQGGVGDTLFIIIKGQAIAEINAKKTATLSDKDYFGEIAILGDIKRTASVKAIEPITAITISKLEFKKFLHQNPVVSTKVMKEVIKKLREMQD